MFTKKNNDTCSKPPLSMAYGWRMIPEHPSAVDLENFVLYHALHALSNREYHAWVRGQGAQGQQWATDMLNSVKTVGECIEFWNTHMDIVSRHESDHGLTILCRALPTAMPLAKKSTPVLVADCCLTAHKARPCYEISSVKNTFPPIYVHQSIMHTVQSLWAVKHWQQIVTAATHSFTHKASTAVLAELCNEFKSSAECAQLVQYLGFVLKDARAVFCEDSMFLQ